MHTHTHIHTCTHTYTCTHTHAHTHIHMHTYTHTLARYLGSGGEDYGQEENRNRHTILDGPRSTCTYLGEAICIHTCTVLLVLMMTSEIVVNDEVVKASSIQPAIAFTYMLFVCLLLLSFESVCICIVLYWRRSHIDWGSPLSLPCR